MTKIFKNKSFKVGFIIISILFIFMLVSFVYTPYDINEINESLKLDSPSLQHPLGTDQFGRDILSRVMYGSREMFAVSILSTLVAVSLGVSIGLISGYFGGHLDSIFMRIIDGFIAIPSILIILIIVSSTNAGILALSLSIGITSIPFYIRIVRSSVKELKNSQMAIFARSKNISTIKILFSYIMPQLFSILIVSIALSLSTAVLTESSLSYLGFINSSVPTWGGILKDAQIYITVNPLFAFVPATLIFFSVYGFNKMADGLNEIIGENT